MKKVLIEKLRNNQLSHDQKIYSAQVLTKGTLSISDIVDEMIRDGIGQSRETILDIISSYNSKSAELAASGYIVNTGLVKIRPIIKGLFYHKKCNNLSSPLRQQYANGQNLYNSINDSSVGMHNEAIEAVDVFNHSNKSNYPTDPHPSRAVNGDLTESNKKNEEEMHACGIIFHNWLRNS